MKTKLLVPALLAVCLVAAGHVSAGTYSLKVSSPTGGSSHRIGDYMTISYCGVNFSPTTPAGTAYIYLMKGDSSIALIFDTQSGVTSCLDSNSVYSWKIGEFPASVPNQIPTEGIQPDSNYKILVDYRDLNGKSVFPQSQSEGSFSILASVSQPTTPATTPYSPANQQTIPEPPPIPVPQPTATPIPLPSPTPQCPQSCNCDSQGGVLYCEVIPTSTLQPEASELPANCTQKGETVTCPVSEVEQIVVPVITGATGSPLEAVAIQKQPDGTIGITSGEVTAVTAERVTIENKRLFVGPTERAKPVRVFPDEAKSVAVASAGFTSVTTVELKNEEQRLVYIVEGIRNSKLFFIPVSIRVLAKIDATSSEVVSIQKPWWSFLTW